MPKSLPHYARIKDRYCCSYLGESPEYLVLLKNLRDQIERQLPGIQFWVACKDGQEFLAGTRQVVAHGKFNPDDYSYVRELRVDNHRHSVLRLMEESALEISPVSVLKPSGKKICLVCPEGIPPVRCVDAASLEALAVREGYTPVVVGSDVHHSLNIRLRPAGDQKLELLRDAGWVLGVENEYLALAGEGGIRTTLVRSGTGEELYKRLFSGLEVISTNP